MHAFEGIGQRLGRHHHPVAQPDCTPHDLLNANHGLAHVSVFLRNVDDIVIELEDPESPGAVFDSLHFIHRALTVAPLQNDDVRRLALQLNVRRRMVRKITEHLTRSFQLQKRLGDTVMAYGGLVDRDRQHPWQHVTGERIPVALVTRFKAEIIGAQTQVDVVRRISCDDRQPALIKPLLLSQQI
ncbi:hypothetical protein D3C84_778470 [compost metagenome]